MEQSSRPRNPRDPECIYEYPRDSNKNGIERRRIHGRVKKIQARRLQADKGKATGTF